MIIPNCINLIKISIKHKKKGFIVAKNIKNTSIIKAFLKINIVKFVKVKDNKMLVYLNYFNNKPVFRNITNLFKPGNKKYLKLKDLIQMYNKYGWIFIISSNKGILNSYEAMKLKTGGLLLVKLWN